MVLCILCVLLHGVVFLQALSCSCGIMIINTLSSVDCNAYVFFSEDRVIEHYKKLNGQSRGQAIVK